ncbi:MAG: hypothetical protein M1833_001273 [Piccolia ochrophora]|nr:MAG: hypothetical protein M1833_001273 [Piccolia ochrophora]
MAATTDVLQVELQDFQDALSPNERQRLQSLNSTPDAGAIIAFTALLDDENAKRRSRCVAGRLFTVLQSIQQFTAVVDTLVSSHPEVAALIWGSVKFALLATSNFTSYFESISVLLMSIGKQCPRFSEYQALYQNSTRLQNALSCFYARIVRFCKQVFLFTQRTGFMQTFKSIWKPFEIEFGPIKAELEHWSNEVREEVLLASQTTMHDENRLQKMERKSAAKHRRFILSQSVKNAAATEEAQRWRIRTDEQKSIGSGKTVITAHLIDHLFGHRLNKEASVLFFFCRFDSFESLRAETIMNSLVRQSLETKTSSTAEDAHLRDALNDPRTRDQRLEELFDQLTTKSRSLYIIIDGIDECAKMERRRLFAYLRKIVCSKDAQVRLFLASREDVGAEIKSLSTQIHHVTMASAEVSSDIETYVQNILDEKVETKDLVIGDQYLLGEIRDALLRGAQGMSVFQASILKEDTHCHRFLWVVFQVQHICSQIRDDDIRRVINDLPRDLSETYNRALSRIIYEKRSSIAQQIFRWVAAAQRPLSLHELREALAVEPSQEYSRPERLVNGIERMTNWCANLVEIDEEDGSVQFAHHSVKSFLLAPPEKSSFDPFHISAADVDHAAGEVCVTYLCFNDFERTVAKRSQLDVPLLPEEILKASLASGMNWTISASWSRMGRNRVSRKAKNGNTVRQINDSLRLETLGSLKKLQISHPFLVYASEHWLLHSSRFTQQESRTWNKWMSLLENNSSLAQYPWTDIEWSLRTPTVIQWVADHDHASLLKFFETHGDELNPYLVQSLLFQAVEKDRPQLLQAILDDGMATRYVLSSVLLKCAEEDNTHIIRRLHSAGADVDSRRTGQTSLHIAAARGHVNTVDALLAAGAAVNLRIDQGMSYEEYDRNISGLTAVDVAIRNGHVGVVSRLVAAGANVPLSLYATGDIWGLEILLAANVSPDLRFDPDNQATALQLAAQGAHYWSVETLLAAGANPNASPPSQDSYSRTALYVAAEKGHVDIMKILLAGGARVNVPMGADRWSALHAAAKYGHLPAIHVLLGAGASPVLGGITKLRKYSETQEVDKVV